MCFLISTDKLLSFLMGPVTVRHGDQEFPPISTLSKIWNYAFRWNVPADLAATEKKDIVRVPAQPSIKGKKLIISTAILIALTGTVQALTLQSSHELGSWKSPASEAAEEINIPEETLPTKLGEWELVDFKTEVREHRTVWARRSSIWDYRRNALEGEVSFHYPYHGWKELQQCYIGIGWSIVTEDIHVDDDNHSWRGLTMTNTSGAHQYVAFMMFDESGEVLTPPSNLTTRLNGLESRWEKSFDDRVTFMVQVRVTSTALITNEYQSELITLGSNASEYLIQKIVNQPKGPQK